MQSGDKQNSTCEQYFRRICLILASRCIKLNPVVFMGDFPTSMHCTSACIFIYPTSAVSLISSLPTFLTPLTIITTFLWVPLLYSTDAQNPSYVGGDNLPSHAQAPHNYSKYDQMMVCCPSNVHLLGFPDSNHEVELLSNYL